MKLVTSKQESICEWNTVYCNPRLIDFSGHLIIREYESNSVLISAVLQKCPGGASGCKVLLRQYI